MCQQFTELRQLRKSMVRCRNGDVGIEMYELRLVWVAVNTQWDSRSHGGWRCTVTDHAIGLGALHDPPSTIQ